jgi:hypothetical protein
MSQHHLKPKKGGHMYQDKSQRRCHIHEIKDSILKKLFIDMCIYNYRKDHYARNKIDYITYIIYIAGV